MDELPETLKLPDNELHQQYIASLDGLQAQYQSIAITRRDEDPGEEGGDAEKVFMLSEVEPELGHRACAWVSPIRELFHADPAILEATAEWHEGRRRPCIRRSWCPCARWRS